MRHAGELEAYFDPRQRAEQHQIIEIAQVTDTKHLVCDLSKAASERHVEVLEYYLAQCHLAVPRRHLHGRERARVLGRVGTLNFESPRLHGSARRVRMAIVA